MEFDTTQIEFNTIHMNSIEFDLSCIEFHTVPPSPIIMKSIHMNSIDTASIVWSLEFQRVKKKSRERERLESDRKMFD